LPARDIYVVREGYKMATRENEEGKREVPENCNILVPTYVAVLKQ